MGIDRAELEGLDRETLVARAQEAGIRRARILTRPELIDELLRMDPSVDERELRKTRGFFGRARDLVARVVERGLHLPDAADRIRTMGTLPPSVPRTEPQAVPTVTLAEIYAAQGHAKRAIETLHLVLQREPDHVAARALLARLQDEAYVPPPPPLPPEPEVEPALAAGEEEEEEEREEEDAADAVDALVEAAHDEGGDAHAAAFAQTAELPSAGSGPHCIAVPIGGGRTYVRWQLERHETPPSGPAVLRAFVVVPSWDGPSTEMRDFPIEREEGETTLHGLPEGAVVRVAVGWVHDDVFVPGAHSPAIEAAAGRGLFLWTVEGAVPLRLDGAEALPLALAVEGARRAAQV